MIKQPERNYRLTDEEFDALMYFLDLHARQDDPNASWLAAKLQKQHMYNPSDEPINYLQSKQIIVIKTPENK